MGTHITWDADGVRMVNGVRDTPGNEALAVEANADVNATNKVLADNYIALTCAAAAAGPFGWHSVDGTRYDSGRVTHGPRGSFFASTASPEDARLIAKAMNAVALQNVTSAKPVVRLVGHIGAHGEIVAVSSFTGEALVPGEQVYVLASGRVADDDLPATRYPNPINDLAAKIKREPAAPSCTSLEDAATVCERRDEFGHRHCWEARQLRALAVAINEMRYATNIGESPSGYALVPLEAFNAVAAAAPRKGPHEPN
jgi:hypothetical protein